MSHSTDKSISGDDDRWMLLQRESSEHLPIVVRARVNSDIQEFAAINNVSAIILDVHPDSVREDGMPTSLDILYELEDRLVQIVADSSIEAYHTASATGDSRRTIYIVHSKGSSLPRECENLDSGIIQSSIYSSIDFETYRDFVTPTDIDIKVDGDHNIFRTISENGDDGSEPRKIDFWFYGAKSALEKLVENLADLDFSVDHWLDENSGVVLSLNSQANVQVFAKLTPLLVEKSEKFGVEYDGWETPLVTDQAKEIARPKKPSFFKRIFGQDEE